MSYDSLTYSYHYHKLEIIFLIRPATSSTRKFKIDIVMNLNLKKLFLEFRLNFNLIILFTLRRKGNDLYSSFLHIKSNAFYQGLAYFVVR